jgi:hypothetical protein
MEYHPDNQSISDSASAHYDNQTEESGSIASTMSQARIAIDCPCCQKELQSRNMFNHIRKIHPDYFPATFRVWNDDQFQDLIDDSKALPVEWYIKNDFDEEQAINIWGCLACNNTFTTEHKAHAHTSNKKCKAVHIKEIKKLQKEEQKERKKRQEQSTSLRQKYLNRSNEDVYYDTEQYLIVTKNKVINEYLPCMKRYGTVITLPEMPTITYSSDKKFLVYQENTVCKYISEVEHIIKSNNQSLPLSDFSDEMYDKLYWYSKIANYAKQSCYDKKPASCNKYYPNVEWGYTSTTI